MHYFILSLKNIIWYTEYIFYPMVQQSKFWKYEDK